MLPVPWQLEPVAHLVCIIGFTSTEKDFATLLQSIEPLLLFPPSTFVSTDLLHANKTTATIRATQIFLENQDFCFAFSELVFLVFNIYMYRSIVCTGCLNG